ncbi:hypothetical protein DPMN_135446 [Dreissena polymorpha]|uniref:Uncharacterized protein n=1 Tax=Dreissena polymorpha TaxID=45954 RepID=A0A9D4FY52_DREPO|nr:hypothetical protein DPMN_135446 [Dreissena polymorpha]
MAINQSTTRVLEALSQSLRYLQQLCQTYGDNPYNQKVEQFIIEMSDIAKKIWRKKQGLFVKHACPPYGLSVVVTAIV